MTLAREEILRRFGFKKLTEDRMRLVAAMRSSFVEIAEDFDKTIPDCREKLIALTKLEEAETFFVKAVVHEGVR